MNFLSSMCFLTLAVVCLYYPKILNAHETKCPSIDGFDFVCGLQNAEDLVHLPNTRWIVASRMMPGGTLALIDSKSLEWTEAALSTSAKVDESIFPNCKQAPVKESFVSHGLSLRRVTNKRFMLYVVGHGGREAIEVYELDTSKDTPVLTWTGCVPTPNNMQANSVTSDKDGSLLVTMPLLPGKDIADILKGDNTGSVFSWSEGDNSMVSVVGTELPYVNGIELSEDQKHFYVVTSGGAQFIKFSNTRPATKMWESEQMDIVPDNLRRAENGQLITAGLMANDAVCGDVFNASKFDFVEFASCPRPFIVRAFDPITLKSTDLVKGPKIQQFSNITTGIIVDDYIWIGSFASNQVARYRIKP